MSATPLPAVPIANPVQANAPRPANTQSQQSHTSFNSHLQDAQQQQSASTDDTQTSASQSDAGQGNPQQRGSSSASPSNSATAHAAASGSTDSQDASSSDDAAADAPAVGNLASAVLNLIDHAADAGKDSSTSSPGTASTKTTTPSATKQTVPAPQPTVLPIAVTPLPQLVAATGASGKQGDTKSAGGSATGSTAAIGGVGGSSTGGIQKSFADADGGAFDASDTSGAAATADGSSQVQGGTDAAQALSGAVTAGHAGISALAAPTAGSTVSNPSDVAALGNIVATATPTPSAPVAGHSLTLNAPVGSSGFAKELGQQVTWLSGQDVKQAQIRLNPQNLGPLDVKISVQHGRVDVAFMAQHPDTAAAVQQGLGQLHQMLGGQGLSLGQATVGQQAQQQFGAPHQQQGQAGSSNSHAEAGADTPVASVIRQVAVGLVDAFA